MKCLAIIPARGGSKRIPRKNIKNFLGAPILAYTVRAALDAGCFDEVMVSTDDVEIAEIAQKAGALVPFLRTAETAGDLPGLADVVAEVLAAYFSKGIEYDYCCCLLPTAPFLTANRLKQGLVTLVNSKVDAVLSVVRFDYPIQRALVIRDEQISMLWPENYSKRSQDLEVTYHDAGQFYWFSTKSFFSQKTLFMKTMVPMILSDSEVQDIDTEDDWNAAELKFQILKQQGLMVSNMKQ